MNTTSKILSFSLAAATLLLAGCATNDEYHDEKEYSDLPWNQQQPWEGSRQLPGMSPGY